MKARVLLLCLLVVAGGVWSAPPEPLLIESAPGVVRFSHERHAGIECVACHHTSTGIRIKRACRSCHLVNSRMPRNRRDAFHGQCIGCHLELKKSGRPGGPAKLCSDCHQGH